MHKKDVTIYDIAFELNVSPSTVSRALKDHYSIGRTTTNKIKALAEEWGYTPRSGREIGTIGVIVSHISVPRISSMLSGIEQVAHENGINVIISQSYGKLENEKSLAKTFLEARVGGLIVSPRSSNVDVDHFKAFDKFNIPVVFVNGKLEGFNSGTVIFDYFTASHVATSHLIEQGCKRIAFVGESHTGNVYGEKLRGYLDALRSHNIPIDEELILTKGILGPKAGEECAIRLLNLANPPDAIFLDNDATAVGVIQYVKGKGLNAPKALAVMGFGDDPISMVIQSPLSAIAHPAIEMGAAAAKSILYQSKRGDTLLKTIVSDVELVDLNSV